MSEREFTAFLARVEPEIRRLETAVGEAYWEATTTGRKEAEERYARLKEELLRLFSNREDFAALQRWKESGAVADPLLARQLTLLHKEYLANQIDAGTIAELVRRETEIESDFTNFRAEVDGQRLSDNEIRQILGRESDPEARRRAWEGSKQIGRQVAGKVVELVRLRNRVARGLGFENYHAMSLQLSEIDAGELFAVLDRLKRLTDAPFAARKAELDRRLARRFGVEPDRLCPWHYSDPFFQEAPKGDVDLDPFFAGKDVAALCRRFYAGIGMDVADILARSDLYERENKNQHAYCIDIDRRGDVRVLANIKPDERWMSTMLHELGHAVYDKYHDDSLPYLLRTPAHISSTEAIAMLMGRLTHDADWLARVAQVPAAEAAALEGKLDADLAFSQLIFVRWALVVVYFERELYRNPDQDLNERWWSLVEELQLLRRPDDRRASTAAGGHGGASGGTDWAAKIHIATVPVYYQNYILGELTASQLHAAMGRELGTRRITDNPAAGRFLIERVFRQGALRPWNDMLEHATGERLNPRHFAEQFIG